MTTPSGDSGMGCSIDRVAVGVWPVERLRAALHERGVLLNHYAEQLFERAEMAVSPPSTLDLVAVTVEQLGLPQGGTRPEVFAAAAAHGLQVCPLATGPYLRLQHREPESSDPVLRRHRPPDGALHVASAPLLATVEVPTGFYLRTVEGRQWLRGYRSDDGYTVAADTTYVFSTTPSS